MPNADIFRGLLLALSGLAIGMSLAAAAHNFWSGWKYHETSLLFVAAIRLGTVLIAGTVTTEILIPSEHIHITGAGLLYALGLILVTVGIIGSFVHHRIDRIL